jgi:hypothetical protein
MIWKNGNIYNSDILLTIRKHVEMVAVLACACDLSRVFLGRSYGMDKRIHLNSAITLRDSQNPQKTIKAIEMHEIS